MYLYDVTKNKQRFRNQVTMIPVDDNIIIMRDGWVTLVFFSLEVSTAGKSYTILVSCRICSTLYGSSISYRKSDDSFGGISANAVNSFGGISPCGSDSFGGISPYLAQLCEIEIVNRLVYLSDCCRSLTEFYLIDDSKSFRNQATLFQNYCESYSRHREISFIPLTSQN